MVSKSLGEAVSKLEAQRRPYAVATVVRVSGSSLGKPGFKMVVSDDGEIVYGTLGGVCPEGPIIAVALESIREEEPRLVKVHLESTEEAVKGLATAAGRDEIFVETFCGGTMEIFVDPVLPPRRLYIIGQGGKDDVEEALVRIGKTLEFEVWVIDPMPMLEAEPDKLITELDFDLSKLEISQRDCVVVLTKGERDVEVLEALSGKRPAYLALMASRKRAARNLELLRERGVSEEFVAKISTPAGIEIGAKTPPEIALSILAEAVARIRGVAVVRKGEAQIQQSTPRREFETTVTQTGLSCDTQTGRAGDKK
ncbi:MAG: XdhC family protein [Nitrososphaerota archaeon]|nr:XdhC family protein [Candidatus Calditenuaceae archaeon]MDW8073663.1 XdhC family protein [Nitrososphaerota archaeon]